MLHPVSLWDVVNVLIDSLGGLSVDEALDAAMRHLPETCHVKM